MSESEPKPFDFGEWIGFCKLHIYWLLITWNWFGSADSWDANGAASFSRRFGYMDKGHDFDGTISMADKALD